MQEKQNFFIHAEGLDSSIDSRYIRSQILFKCVRVLSMSYDSIKEAMISLISFSLSLMMTSPFNLNYIAMRRYLTKQRGCVLHAPVYNHCTLYNSSRDWNPIKMKCEAITASLI